MTLKNQKGQAILEAVIALPLMIFFTFYFILHLLFLSVDLALDQALEKALLCGAREGLSCEVELRSHPVVQTLDARAVRLTRSGDFHFAEVRGKALGFFKIVKQRSLRYELNVSST